MDAESIRCYRSGVDPFVKHCKKATVEEVKKQDMLDFMGWMRKQPLPKRRRSNPNRTYNNKVSYVAIFLKEFGVSRGGRHPPRNAVRESAPLTANRVA